ncbi:MAG: hypothetical protein GEV28_13775 [Actinophytocola sp.]|uniref:hypothetical protein n=1 Tax=Actinophytocola sp. TaxID=1872138 RepID=UPI0013267A04|nr:hypothetical protein [Actinophytocola sp.]MPZ81405.1 hypothetical protein [Actinophytocola sp.]
MSTPFDGTELTPEDRLITQLVGLEEKFPGGYQVALGIRLSQSAEAAEALFTANDLPMREELIAELTYWRCHAEEGLKFLEHSRHVVAAVMARIRSTEPR